MPTKRTTIFLLLMLVLFSASTIPAPVASACGGDECHPPHDRYYVVMNSEGPDDWCNFAEGSGVYLKFDPNISNSPIEGYYFVLPGDWSTSAPAGFYSQRAWVYNNQYAGCGYSWF